MWKFFLTVTEIVDLKTYYVKHKINKQLVRVVEAYDSINVIFQRLFGHCERSSFLFIKQGGQ